MDQKSKYIPAPDKNVKLENLLQRKPQQSAVDAMRQHQILYNIAMNEYGKFTHQAIQSERQVKLVTTKSGLDMFHEAMKKEAMNRYGWIPTYTPKKTRRKQKSQSARIRDFMGYMKEEQDRLIVQGIKKPIEWPNFK